MEYDQDKDEYVEKDRQFTSDSIPQITAYDYTQNYSVYYIPELLLSYSSSLNNLFRFFNRNVVPENISLTNIFKNIKYNGYLNVCCLFEGTYFIATNSRTITNIFGGKSLSYISGTFSKRLLSISTTSTCSPSFIFEIESYLISGPFLIFIPCKAVAIPIISLE